MIKYNVQLLYYNIKISKIYKHTFLVSHIILSLIRRISYKVIN